MQALPCVVSPAPMAGPMQRCLRWVQQLHAPSMVYRARDLLRAREAQVLARQAAQHPLPYRRSYLTCTRRSFAIPRRLLRKRMLPCLWTAQTSLPRDDS